MRTGRLARHVCAWRPAGAPVQSPATDAAPGPVTAPLVGTAGAPRPAEVPSQTLDEGWSSAEVAAAISAARASTSPAAAILLAALGYARRAIATYPINRQTRVPCLRSPGNGRGGHHQASTDPMEIVRWLGPGGRMIGANIAARVPDAVVVLDVDVKTDELRASVEATFARLGPLPETLTVDTGRGDGSRHLWFRHPGGDLVSEIAAGIEIKAGGRTGITMPPSLHRVTGRAYAWIDVSTPIACLPAAWVDAVRRPVEGRLTKPARTGGSPVRWSGLVDAVRQAEPGRRHAVLLWASCRARQEGAPEELLGELAEASADSGHDPRQARTTIASTVSLAGVPS